MTNPIPASLPISIDPVEDWSLRTTKTGAFDVNELDAPVNWWVHAPFPTFRPYLIYLNADYVPGSNNIDFDFVELKTRNRFTPLNPVNNLLDGSKFVAELPSTLHKATRGRYALLFIESAYAEQQLHPQAALAAGSGKHPPTASATIKAFNKLRGVDLHAVTSADRVVLGRIAELASSLLKGNHDER
jgi:hypothetical protein